MQRDLPALADNRFDLAVIGGGATGAFVAWEAATRGLRVALVERDDFSHATSAANSRLIHGGLRYLPQGQLQLVREAARERSYWLRAAPHLVRPLPFLLPTHSLRERARLGIGLRLYDWLGADDTGLLPRSRWLSAPEAARLEPRLAEQLRHGAWLYHDAQMHAPERLVLAALRGVVDHGGIVANRTRVEGLLRAGERVRGVRCVDGETGAGFDLQALHVVNATGPWADTLLERDIRLTRSTGIHLVVPAIVGHAAVAVHDEVGHLFLLPWRGHTLIGTTDQRFDGNPDAYRITTDDVRQLLARLAALLPELAIGADVVRHAYGGLRPLVDQDGGTYRASRRAEIIDHGNHGHRGLLTVLGGKWTTSRALAERVIDRLSGVPSRTRDMPLPGRSEIGVVAPADPVLRHLSGLYGAEAVTLRAMIGEEARLAGAEPVFAAQARHAVREEMARSLGDVVFRRTQLGLFGCPPRATLATLAATMAPDLGWSRARIEEEISAVEASYLR